MIDVPVGGRGWGGGCVAFIAGRRDGRCVRASNGQYLWDMPHVVTSACVVGSRQIQLAG